MYGLKLVSALTAGWALLYSYVLLFLCLLRLLADNFYLYRSRCHLPAILAMLLYVVTVLRGLGMFVLGARNFTSGRSECARRGLGS